MKFIFSFFICLIFVLPVLANNQCENLTQNTTPTCTASGGCVWDYGACSQCQSGTYSAPNDNTCTPCPTGFDSDWTSQHKTHPKGASSCSDWECESNYFPTDTNNDGNYDICSPCDPTTLPQNAQFTDSCAWRCNTGYYKNGTTCNSCPSNSTTNAPGATNISQCFCTGSHYMTSNNTCAPCPEHVAQCNSLSYTDVTCESGYIKSVSNGIVTCSPCPEHAVQSGSTCKCNKGYYGDGNTCTACPYGTTSALGSTDVSNCQMTPDTQFCDANGENCMKLLSDATNIN